MVNNFTMISELLAADYYPYKWDDDLRTEVSLLQLQEPTPNSFPNKNDYFIAIKAYDTWLYACKEAPYIGKPHAFMITFGPKVSIKDHATPHETPKIDFNADDDNKVDIANDHKKCLHDVTSTVNNNPRNIKKKNNNKNNNHKKNNNNKTNDNNKKNDNSKLTHDDNNKKKYNPRKPNSDNNNTDANRKNKTTETPQHHPNLNKDTKDTRDDTFEIIAQDDNLSDVKTTSCNPTQKEVPPTHNLHLS